MKKITVTNIMKVKNLVLCRDLGLITQKTLGP